jgi:hypothetical protein
MGGAGAMPIPNIADLPQFSLMAGKNAFLSVEMALSTAKVGFISGAWRDIDGSASSGIFRVPERAGRELAAEFGARLDA